MSRIDLELEVTGGTPVAAYPVFRVAADPCPRIIAIGVVEPPTQAVLDHSAELRVIRIPGRNGHPDSRPEEAEQIAPSLRPVLR